MAATETPSIRLVSDPPDRIALRWNLVPHSMTATQVVEKLLWLATEGLIFFECESNGSSTQLLQALPSTQRLESAQRGQADLNYGLTQKGGIAWEQLASPKWDLFSGETYAGADDASLTVTISCASLERLSRIVEFNLAVCMHKEITGMRGNIRSLSPWQATYWKQLTSGVEATYSYRSKPGLPDEGELMSTCRGMRVWCSRGFNLNTCERLFTD